PPLDTTEPALLRVADAVDRPGEVVAYEQRAVLHHRHVDRSAAVEAVLIKPALGEDGALVGRAIGFERDEVDQGTGGFGAVPRPVRGDEDTALILGGEHLAVVEGHAQLRLVRGEFYLRLRPVRGRRHVLQVRRGRGTCDLDAVAVHVGIAEVLASRLGDAVEFAGRCVVAHAVRLVVGEPYGLILGIDVHSDRIAHTPGDHLATRTVEGVEPDHAAN